MAVNQAVQRNLIS